jgi:hypothetical protein
MKDMGKKIVYAKSEGKKKGKTTNDRKGKKPLQESLDSFIGFAFCQKRGKADSGQGSDSTIQEGQGDKEGAGKGKETVLFGSPKPDHPWGKDSKKQGLGEEVPGLPKLISEQFEGIRTRKQDSMLIPNKRDDDQLWG